MAFRGLLSMICSLTSGSIHPGRHILLPPWRFGGICGLLVALLVHWMAGYGLCAVRAGWQPAMWRCSGSRRRKKSSWRVCSVPLPLMMRCTDGSACTQWSGPHQQAFLVEIAPGSTSWKRTGIQRQERPCSTTRTPWRDTVQHD